MPREVHSTAFTGTAIARAGYISYNCSEVATVATPTEGDVINCSFYVSDPSTKFDFNGRRKRHINLIW